MKRLISVGLATALLLAAVPVVMAVLQELSPSGGAAASPALTCTMKAPPCGGGEVEVFRMSAVANAHAQTAATATYGQAVCCSGPAGLSNACSGNYDTVLELSATDNGHVAEAPDASYTTEVCLSADTAPDCEYVTGGGDCGAGYACLATISGTTNAHVADCDGSNDYDTKVCCSAQAAAVGGIAELPRLAGTLAEESGVPAEDARWPVGTYAGLAAGVAAAVLALGGAAWYARRRWVR